MLGRGVLRLAVGEHLHLVELVDAEDAAGVLAVGAGLAAEAGRPAGVAHGAVGQVDDLVGVVAGQRDLGGADQVQVVFLQVVDLVGVRAEEAGAGHGLGADEHRGDHQLEAVLRRLLRGKVEQAELQHRAGAGEEVEARSGDLRAAFHVDQAERFAQVQVVLRLEVELGDLADVLEDHVVVLAAGGRPGDDVAELHLQLVHGGLGLALFVFGVLDAAGEGLGLFQQGGALLLGGRADLLAEALVLGAQRIGGGDGVAPARIGVEQLVDEGRVLAAGALRFADDVGVVAEEFQIDHVPRVPAGGRRLRGNRGIRA